jgi:hypothetical protein
MAARQSTACNLEGGSLFLSALINCLTPLGNGAKGLLHLARILCGIWFPLKRGPAEIGNWQEAANVFLKFFIVK